MPNSDNSVSGDRENPSRADREALERARINSETSTIPWAELQRFFAQGNAIFVSEQLDLVDVAREMSRDRKEAVEAWMAAGELGRVRDAQAIEWLEADALMWCVVVRPWVLVQPVARPRQD